MTEIKTFERKEPLGWIEFQLNGEKYRAMNTAPASAMLDVAAVNDTKGAAQIKLVMSFLDQVMPDEDAERLAASLKSKTNPTEIDQVTEIAVWLVEGVYAKERPSEAPSSSPNGSGSTGPSTTGTASTGDSTQEPSTRRVV